MKCSICNKELKKGEKCFVGYETFGYGHYPTHSSIFCSKKCASKNGHSEAEEHIIKYSDEEYKEKVDKAVKYLEKIGFEFPTGTFPFSETYNSMKVYSNEILIAALPR